MIKVNSFTTRVLALMEDGEWCAISLETSLRGYGSSPQAAMDVLYEAIAAQISFAIQHDSLDQILIPAEPVYFELFADVRRESIKRWMKDKTNAIRDMMVFDMPFPEPEPSQFVAA